MTTGVKVLSLAVMASAIASYADTIYFKDGSSLDGTVTREGRSRVVLQLPQGRMTFPMSDVDRIEDNDKQAPPDAQADTTGRDSATEQPPHVLRELDRQGKRELREMLDGLLVNNPAGRDAARQRIQRFGEEHDLFPFLERALPYMPDRQSVEVLQVLSDLDARRAKHVLEKSAQSHLDKNRAKALTLLGATQGEADSPDDLTLFARGVLDDAPEVQLAGIQALHAANDKRATPVLVHALTSPDRRVQSASLKALKALWADANFERNLDSADAWRMLLTLADEDVQTTFDPQRLEPLVEAPEAGDTDYNLELE